MRMRKARLCQNFIDGLDADIGQGHRTAANLIVLLVIDADGLKDRRKDLARADFAFFDCVSVLVAGAIDSSAADAATSERYAPCGRKVITSQTGVDLWRAT